MHAGSPADRSSWFPFVLSLHGRPSSALPVTPGAAAHRFYLNRGCKKISTDCAVDNPVITGRFNNGSSFGALFLQRRGRAPPIIEFSTSTGRQARGASHPVPAHHLPARQLILRLRTATSSLCSGAGKEDGEQCRSAAAYPPPSAPEALSRGCWAWRGGGGAGRERESLRARREDWVEALCGILLVDLVPVPSSEACGGSRRPGPVRSGAALEGRRHLCSGLAVSERAPPS